MNNAQRVCEFGGGGATFTAAAAVEVESLLSPAAGNDGAPRPYTVAELEALFAISPVELEELQLAGLQRRFGELSSRLPALTRLADQNRLTTLGDIDDVVPLLFPHTAYKSYPLSLIDNCRFGHLNRWLDDYTTHELGDIDVSVCGSLSEWLDVVESATPVRVMVSSGTSGKVSLVPKSTVEERKLLAGYVAAYSRFGDEPGLSDPTAPELHYVFPFARHSRHSTGVIIRAAIAGLGADERVLSLAGAMPTDLLWLSGRIKKAQADGSMEQLKATPSWKRLAGTLAAAESDALASLDDFFVDMVQRVNGKPVFMVMGLNYLWKLVECVEQHGLDISFAEGSIVSAAGGSKWDVLSDAQKEKLWATIPLPNVDAYGFSEILNGVAKKCSASHYHPPPWVVHWVLDPDTGAPYPRSGVRTGRGAQFDLWAETYWGGFISSDEVTMHWDGGCDCGRVGHYLSDTITRYTDKRGGDDKITCQRTADAVTDAAHEIGLG